jgi:hypothetical protein
MSEIFLGLNNKKENNSDNESESESSFIDNYNDLMGGNKTPNGGFPPIKMCEDDNKDKKIEKIRSFSSNSKENKLTIHDILDDTSKVPMFNLD